MRAIRFRLILTLQLIILTCATTLSAQTPASDKPPAASAPQDASMNMSMEQSYSSDLITTIEGHTSSGTSVEPAVTNSPMLMAMKHSWMLMLHGTGYFNVQQQSGARGYDKMFSTNWLMFMAQRDMGPGKFTFRMMNSLEPATITGKFYPELFQVGETANGRPIIDGQHPHDFFMELAVLYDIPVDKRSLLSFYFAPVGDPAVGPVAYPHRASASADPLATLGHHLEDSTHIASDVMTVGLTHRIFRLEASGFHGREPDERRWNIDSGRIDSWSSRLTVVPIPHLAMQYSLAHLTSPEFLHPLDDVLRMTASISYVRSFQNIDWSSSLVWGRNHTISSHDNANGYLLESLLEINKHHSIWIRIENVDRTNEITLGKSAPPSGFLESPYARIQAYTGGYAYEWLTQSHVALALGSQLTLFAGPPKVTAIYGQHPLGALLYLRMRLIPKQ